MITDAEVKSLAEAIKPCDQCDDWACALARLVAKNEKREVLIASAKAVEPCKECNSPACELVRKLQKEVP